MEPCVQLRGALRRRSAVTELHSESDGSHRAAFMSLRRREGARERGAEETRVEGERELIVWRQFQLEGARSASVSVRTLGALEQRSD